MPRRITGVLHSYLPVGSSSAAPLIVTRLDDGAGGSGSGLRDVFHLDPAGWSACLGRPGRELGKVCVDAEPLECCPMSRFGLGISTACPSWASAWPLHFICRYLGRDPSRVLTYTTSTILRVPAVACCAKGGGVATGPATGDAGLSAPRHPIEYQTSFQHDKSMPGTIHGPQPSTDPRFLQGTT